MQQLFNLDVCIGCLIRLKMYKERAIHLSSKMRMSINVACTRTVFIITEMCMMIGHASGNH